MRMGTRVNRDQTMGYKVKSVERKLGQAIHGTFDITNSCWLTSTIEISLYLTSDV